MITEAQRRLVLSLYDIGVLKDKRQSPDGKGFRFKLHEKSPGAPLSPIYLNLRTPDNPKPGPLTPAIVVQISRELSLLAIREKLVGTYVVGVPRAGDPFARAISEIEFFGRTTPLLQMEKEESGDHRSIAKLVEGNHGPGDIAIVIDDVVTQADSKFEAIQVLEANGLVVEDILVFLDWEQGGAEELRKKGYALHSLFTLSEFLQIGLEDGKLDPGTFEEIQAYLTSQ